MYFLQSLTAHVGIPVVECTGPINHRVAVKMHRSVNLKNYNICKVVKLKILTAKFRASIDNVCSTVGYNYIASG